ncbi:MAG: hypothetical protein RLP14_00255 [Owenweeksia sp.]
MRSTPFALVLAFLLTACSTPDKEPVKAGKKQEPQAFETMAKVVTKGLPKGFLQRDYTLSADGKIAYTTIQLPNRKRSFIIQIDLNKKLPVLASFSGTYNDLEPMLVPGDTILLFASDRPLFEGDTTRDYNIWQVSVNGLKTGNPEPLDTLVNTRYDEFYPSMSRDGELYFTAIYPGHKRDDLYMSLKTDSGYTQPVMLSFCRNNDFYEFNSYIVPGGDTLLFTSGGRPGEIGGGDLFMAYRDTAGEWQAPFMLQNDVNTAGLDFSPFVRRDTLYLTSKRQDKGWESKKFNYLAEITAYADSSVIGEQSIYFTRLSRLFKEEEEGKN